MKTTGSRRGGILSGLLLTGLVIVILGVLAASWLVHNVRIKTADRSDGKDLAIDVPGGHVTVRSHDRMDAGALGAPVYPGATRNKAGGATFEWTSGDGTNEKDVAVAGGDLVTPDAADKVVEWYRTRLPAWRIVTERDGAVRMEDREGRGKLVLVIRHKSDGTHIGVASIGEPASN